MAAEPKESVSGVASTQYALYLKGPRQLEWVEEPLPPIESDSVLVETTAGAISVGSELPQFMGTSVHVNEIDGPVMTGYESLARIREVGSEVTDLSVGDRIVSAYGHRTHDVVPRDQAIPVPNDISDEAALLTILTGDVMRGIRAVDPRRNDQVLVSGAGAIGLLAVWSLNVSGVHRVDVVEPRPERRDRALAFGAQHAWSPESVKDDISDSYPIGFECSGRDEAFRQLQRLMAPSGRMGVLADGHQEPFALTTAFHDKELAILGSSDCRDYSIHADWYFQVQGQVEAPLEKLFDHRITADELPGTFEKMAQGDIVPLKVRVDYDVDR